MPRRRWRCISGVTIALVLGGLAVCRKKKPVVHRRAKPEFGAARSVDAAVKRPGAARAPKSPDGGVAKPMKRPCGLPHGLSVRLTYRELSRRLAQARKRREKLFGVWFPAVRPSEGSRPRLKNRLDSIAFYTREFWKRSAAEQFFHRLATNIAHAWKEPMWKGVPPSLLTAPINNVAWRRWLCGPNQEVQVDLILEDDRSRTPVIRYVVLLRYTYRPPGTHWPKIFPREEHRSITVRVGRVLIRKWLLREGTAFQTLDGWGVGFASHGRVRIGHNVGPGGFFGKWWIVGSTVHVRLDSNYWDFKFERTYRLTYCSFGTKGPYRCLQRTDDPKGLTLYDISSHSAGPVF